VSHRLRKRRLVRERDPRSMRQLGVLFALCAAATALFLFSLRQRVELTRLNYRIEELRGKRAALVETQKGLRLERSALRSLPRVERLARQRLGMAPAEPQQMLVASDAGVVAAATLPSTAHGRAEPWRGDARQPR